MSYLNGITEVNSSAVTSLREQMSMLFSINEIDAKHAEKLTHLLNEANCYEGYFKVHSWEGFIRSINYETDYSDDWLCYGAETFGQIIDDCVSEIIKKEEAI